MREICFCGRDGEIEDRTLITDRYGRSALQCPDCGDVDMLNWLDRTHRERVLEEARRRSRREQVAAA